MPKYTITVERTVTGDNQADAISRFLERPFGYGASTNIVEVQEPEPADKAPQQATFHAWAFPDVRADLS